MIIVTSLHRDFLPSSWFYFKPTFWDVATMIGSFGLFFTMFCLFVRFLPIVATAEVKIGAAAGGGASARGAGDRARRAARPAERWPPGGPLMALLRPSLPPGERFGAARRVRDPGRALPRLRRRARRRLHALGRAHAVPRARPRRAPWACKRLAPALDRRWCWRSAARAAGMGLQGWVSTIAYPLVISGKPFFSWPAFVPVTFELAVLGGALGAVFGMFALNQLPTLYHPLFASTRFERASDDGFFISIESLGSQVRRRPRPPSCCAGWAPTHVELVAS